MNTGFILGIFIGPIRSGINELFLSSSPHPLKQLRHVHKILGQIVNTHLDFQRKLVFFGNGANLLI